MIKTPSGYGHYVEKHEHGQSQLNYRFDFLQNVEILNFDKGYTEFAKNIETLSLKKKNYDCYEDNSMQMKDCIDEYIAEEMGCNLPWNKPHSTNKQNIW